MLINTMRETAKLMKRVDLVSDNQTMLKMLHAGLVLEEYDAQAFMLHDYPFPQEGYVPDLIVVDVFQLEEQGERLCQRWNNTEQTRHIPLLFLSDSFHKVKSHGATLATDFLRKPFHMPDLFLMVQKYISKGSPSL